MADDRNARVVLSADVSQYQQQMAAAAASTQQYAKTLDTAQQRQQSFIQSGIDGLDKFGKSILAFQTGMVAITATLQKQMSTIEGVFASRGGHGGSAFGSATKEIDTMRSGIKSLSTELPMARGQIAQLMTSISKMGITSGQAITDLTSNFAKLSLATGEDPTGLAAGQIGLSRQMGTITPTSSPATMNSSIQRQNNSLNYLSASAGVPAQSVLDFSQSIAPPAKAAGMSQQQVMGTSAAFVAGGAEGGYAANAFTSILNEISALRATKSDDIAKYSFALGISKADLQKMTPYDIANKLIKSIGEDESGGVAKANMLGFEGTRMQKSLQAVNAAGGLDKYVNEAYRGANGNSVAEGSAAASGGLMDQLDILKNKFTDMGDSIGSALLPAFTTLAKIANAVATPFEKLAQIMSPVLTIVGTLSVALSGLLKVLALGGTAALINTAVRGSFGQGIARGRTAAAEARAANQASGAGLFSPNRVRASDMPGWAGQNASMGARFAQRIGAAIPFRMGGSDGTGGVVQGPLRQGFGMAMHGVDSTVNWLARTTAAFNRASAVGDAGIRSQVGPDGRMSDGSKAPGGFWRAARWGYNDVTGHGDRNETTARNKIPNTDLRSEEARKRDQSMGEKVAAAHTNELNRNVGYLGRFGQSVTNAAAAAKMYTASLTAPLRATAGMAAGGAIGLGQRAGAYIAPKLGSLAGALINPYTIAMGGVAAGASMYSAVKKSNEQTAQMTDPNKQSVDRTDALNTQTKYNQALGIATNALGQFAKGLDAAHPAKYQDDVEKSLKDPSIGAMAAETKSYTDPRVGNLQGMSDAKAFVASQGKMTADQAALVFTDLKRNPNITSQNYDQLVKWYTEATDNGKHDPYDAGGSGVDSTSSAIAMAETGKIGGKKGWLARYAGVATKLPYIGDALKAFKLDQFAIDQSKNEILDSKEFQDSIGIGNANAYRRADERQQAMDFKAPGALSRRGEEMEGEDYKRLSSLTDVKDRLAKLVAERNDLRAKDPGNSAGIGAREAAIEENLNYLKGTGGMNFSNDFINQLYDSGGNSKTIGKLIEENLTANTKSTNKNYGSLQDMMYSGFGMGNLQDFQAWDKKLEPAKMKKVVQAALDNIGASKEINDLVASSPELQGVLSGDNLSENTMLSGMQQAKSGFTRVQLLNLAAQTPPNSVGQQVLQGAAAEQVSGQERFNPVLSRTAQNDNLLNRQTESWTASYNDRRNIPQLKEDTNALKDSFVQQVAELQNFDLSRKREAEDYQRERQQSEEAFNRSMANSNEDYQQSVLWAEQDFYKQRARAAEDFARQQKQSIEDFNIQGQRSTDQYNKSVKRSVEDYNLQKKYSIEDFNRGQLRATQDFQRSLDRGEFDFNKSRIRAIQDHNTQKKWTLDDFNRQQRRGEIEHNLSIKRAWEDYTKSDTRAVADFEKNKLRSIQDFNKSRARADYDYFLNRQRSVDDHNKAEARTIEDYNLSVQRSDYDHKLSVKRSWADFYVSLERSEYDFNKNRDRSIHDHNLSNERAQEDFNLSVLRSWEDFHKQMKRSSEDYYKQEKYMLEDSAKGIYDVYQRIYGVQTASGETILSNMKEQNDAILKQRQQLDQLKQKGMTQQTIDILGLTDPKNAQQLTRLYKDVLTDPKLLADINKEAADRASATTSLVDNEDNTTLRRQREQFKLSQDRAAEDFATSLDRSLTDFEKSIERGNLDFQTSLDRSREDYSKSLERSWEDFLKNMDRGEEDYRMALARGAEDLAKSLQRSNDDFQLSLIRSDTDYRESLARSADDFAISLQRSQDDFDLARERGYQDFLQSLARGEEDYKRAIANAVEDLIIGLMRGDEQFRLSMKRSYEDYVRSINLAVEDFKRANQFALEDFIRQLRRGDAEFAKSLRRGAEDFAQQMQWSVEDFTRTLRRSTDNFRRSMDYSLIDFNRNLWQGDVNFHKSMVRAVNEHVIALKQADKNRAISLKRQNDDFLGQAKLSSMSYEALYKNAAQIVEKYFGRSGDVLNGQLRNMKDQIKSGENMIANTSNRTSLWIKQLERAVQLATQASRSIGGRASGTTNAGGLSGTGNAWSTGGFVTGPGTSTSDSIFARLSNGEYVVKAEAVKKVGVANLDAINRGHISKSAQSVFVANKGITAESARAQVNNYTATNFNGEITVKANDPKSMITELQAAARSKVIRGLATSGV